MASASSILTLASRTARHRSPFATTTPPAPTRSRPRITKFLKPSYSPKTAATNSADSWVSRRRRSSLGGGGDEIEELGQIHVAPGNDGDNRTLPCLSGQCRRERQCACALGDDARLVGHQSHRLPR